LARKIYAEEQLQQVVVAGVVVVAAPYMLADDVVVDAVAAVEKHIVGVHHVEADGALNGFELHMLRVVAVVVNEMLLPLNVVVVAAGDDVVVAAEVDAAIVVGDRTYTVVALAFAAAVVVAAAAVVALVGAFVAAAIVVVVAEVVVAAVVDTPGPFEIVVVVVDNDGCYLSQKFYGLVHKMWLELFVVLVFAAALAVSTVAEAVVKAVVGLKIVKFLLFWSFRMMKILFDLQPVQMVPHPS